MSLLSLITAFLLEQLHPISSRKYLYTWLSAYVDFFQRNFNAGELKHGRIAWILAIAAPLVVVTGIHWILIGANPIFAWAFSVLVLYLTMGFRKFSHFYTDIHKALRDNELDKARALLTAWSGKSCRELSSEEVARVTIEQALLASHRNVFGVVFGKRNAAPSREEQVAAAEAIVPSVFRYFSMRCTAARPADSKVLRSASMA